MAWYETKEILGLSQPLSDRPVTQAQITGLTSDDYVNVLDYGAIGDGVQDDSVAFANAIATGKNVYVPQPSVHFKLNTGITLQANQTIFGLGRKSIIKYNGTLRCIILTGSNAQVLNLQIFGNKTGNFETGINVSGAIGWRISGCYIHTFGGSPVANGGGGIFMSSIAASNSESGIVSDCTIRNCLVGINLANRAEYVTLSNVHVHASTTGFRAEAGNISWTGGNLQGNTTAIKLETGTNDGHSSFVGLLCNHNTTNLNINGILNGNVFSACHFYSGNIILTSNKGIRFLGCDFHTGTITLTTNTSIQRANCRVPIGATAGAMTVSLVSGNAITEINNMDF